MNKEILVWNDLATIKIVHELQNGGVILGTSDTVLGFFACVSEQSMITLNRIKGRSEKPYIVLIGHKSSIFDFTDVLMRPAQTLVDTCWPGPLTLIVKAKDGLPSYVQGAHGTVALRMPNHKGLFSLLQDIPALFSTSANIAGNPVPACLEDVDPEILRQVKSIIMDDSSKTCTKITPSTIIDCTSLQLKVVREGAYAIDTLELIVGQKFLRT